MSDNPVRLPEVGPRSADRNSSTHKLYRILALPPLHRPVDLVARWSSSQPRSPSLYCAN